MTRLPHPVLSRLAWGLGYAVPVVFCLVLHIPLLSSGAPGPLVAILLVTVFGLAIAVARDIPLLSLGLTWAGAAITVVAAADLSIIHVAIPLIVYLVVRHGGALVLGLSALTILCAPVIGFFYLSQINSSVLYASQLLSESGARYDLVLLGVLFIAVLLPAMLGGLVRLARDVRRSRRAQREAEAKTAAALELAHIRAEHTRLARDVHDIVGHSLVVIIAQANAVSYLGPESFSQVRGITDSISEVARRSLADVRQVLADSEEIPGDLADLLGSVRSSGREVNFGDHGTAIELPAATRIAVYRVVQELLTNALKFSAPESVIAVHQTWEAQRVRIVVSNPIAAHWESSEGGGRGLPGARDRLLLIGGTLAIDLGEDTFTATVEIPVD